MFASLLLLPVVFVAIVVGVTFAALLRIRLRVGSYRSVLDAEAVPVAVRDLFAATRAELAGHGFASSHFQGYHEILVAEGQEKHREVLRHATGEAYAFLQASTVAGGGGLGCKAMFASFLPGGRVLMTVNAEEHGIFGEVPGTVIADAWAPSLEAQWRTHQERLSREGARASSVTPAQIDAWSNQSDHGYVMGLWKRRLLRREAENRFRFVGLAALRFAVRLAWGAIRAQRLQKRMAASMSTPHQSAQQFPLPGQPEAAAAATASRHELEAGEFLRQQSAQGPLSGAAKGWIVLGSALLFALATGLSFSISGVIILMAVLALHEGGHLLAMRLAGYRNLGVLFLPFLGAAATGRGGFRVAAWKEAIVLLAGPVPGLLLGVALFAAPFVAIPLGLELPPIPSQLPLMLVGINLLNLLPVSPFDGGRLLGLLLFRRVPLLEVIFSGLGAAALVAMGLRMSDRFLPILATMIAISLPAQYRLRMAARELSRRLFGRGGDLSEEEYVRHAFAVLSEGAFARLSFQQKMALVKGLLAAPCGDPAGLGATALFLVFYLVFLAPALVWGAILFLGMP